MPEKDQKEFTFMNEQLKKKPFYRKRWFQKGLSAGALALIFGTTAGFTFSVVQPWAEKQFGRPDEPSQIIVVRDDTETELMTEGEQQEKQGSSTRTVVQKKELDIPDYKMLYEKMSEVAKSVLPAMVTVTGETSNLDWFDEVIENHVQASGLVIAKSEQEYFILTGSHAVESAERIVVTFSDGSVADASLQKRDRVTGLAVVKVAKEGLGNMPEIVPAELYTSKTADRGEPVISLGTPVANNSSMSFGMITSVVDTPVVDAQYRILHTDILGIEQASGVLIDLDGRVVGIIAQNFQADIGQITMSALAPADIQILVGNLANNREWSYLGITGKDIDGTSSQEYDMPRGIYVRSVASESPAMYAGIYETDIITRINGEEIRNIEDYEKEIRGHSPDEVIRVGIKRATMEGYVDMELSVQLGHG